MINILDRLRIVAEYAQRSQTVSSGCLELSAGDRSRAARFQIAKIRRSECGRCHARDRHTSWLPILHP